LNWNIVLMAWACAAAFLSAVTPAFGRSSSEGDGPLLPFSLQPSPPFSANFSLSSFSASHAGAKEIGSGPLTFSSQQQPFVEPRVRLRDDDPEYTKKSSVWSAAFRVVMVNALLWGVDRFVFNYDYSHIGPATWKHNLQTGWEWDTDRLGMNLGEFRGNDAAVVQRSDQYDSERCVFRRNLFPIELEPPG
jgi:hypothetical protein